jgi:hypothetical protein
MMIPSSRAGRIARAKAYPFGHPAESYLFEGGRAVALGDVRAATEGRVPVLASGSNAAPDQLARKYAAHPGTVIPVTRARLKDFDSVFNAHIAAYGSVPATLCPSPGTVLRTFITWLDAAALDVMHATEQPGINYHYASLDGIEVAVEGLGTLDRAFAYISVVGCLVHEDAPVALADVPAEGRCLPARGQEEMLALVRDRTAPGAILDDFIDETVLDAELRLARSARLAETARAIAHPGLRVIAV